MEDKNLPVLSEKTYVKETAMALWENLPWVVLAGFLFSLVSLPAVFLALLGFLVPGILVGAFTAGPGWVALTDLMARSLLRVPGRSILDFFRALGHYYVRGTVLGAFMAVPLAAAAMTLPSLQATRPATIVWVGLGADLAIFFLLAVLYLYAFPQIVIYDVGIKVALRNSFVLAARYLGNSLGLIGLAVLLGFLADQVTWLLWVILPATWSVFVINNCRMVVRNEMGGTGQAS